MAQCSSLSERIGALRQEKYEHVVQEYEEEERKKMEFLLSKERRQLEEGYAAKRKELSAVFDSEKAKLAKTLEDIAKFKTAYASILEELSDRRAKIEKEYADSTAKVQEVKERLAGEWKRSSNEELSKLGLRT